MMAERVGFETTVILKTTPVFKTGPIDRSGTSPSDCSVMRPIRHRKKS